MAMHGWDLSNWQSNETVDSSPDFVIIKATEGTGYVDPSCDAKYQRAKAQGKLRGVYHFARPDYNDAVSEANFFVDNIRGYLHDAIIVLDWEVNTWEVPWAKAWLDEVYRLTGIRPLIYMSASVVNNYDWRCISSTNGLWIAGYPSEYDVANPPTPPADYLPYSIGAWQFAVMWQYTSSAGTLDRNIAWIDQHAWNLYGGIAEATTTEEPKTEPTPEPSAEPTEEPAEEPTAPDLPTPDAPTVDDVPAQPESTDKGLTVEEYNAIIGNIGQTVELVDAVAKKYGFKLTMPSWLYDALKLIAVVILPACSMLYLGLANIWGFGFGEQVDQTIQLAITVINTIVGLTVVKASKDYKNEQG